MFEALHGPHDRLLFAFAAAGEQGRFLGNTTLVVPDPLEIMLRSLSNVDFAALVTLLSTIDAYGGPYRHEGLGAVPPPTKRLLEPFLGVTCGHFENQFVTDWSKSRITTRLRAVDSEAFATLTSVVQAETARRG